MGKKTAPSPPDYGPLAAASEKSAKYSYNLGKEQLAWAKKQYNLDSATVNKFMKRAFATQAEQMKMAREQQQWGREDRARYERLFQPLEGDLVRDAKANMETQRRLREEAAPIRQAMLDEAKRYGDPAFREAEAGRAMADVGAQMDGARRAALTNLESFGINPSATRYAALDMGAGLSRAAAQAAAGNMRRDQVDATRAGYQDRALGMVANQEALAQGVRSEGINVGRGYPSQAMGAMGGAAGSYAGSVGSGAAGVGARQQQTQLGSQMMGTPVQWQGMGNNAVGMWGDILNAGYNNQLNAWQANQQASSGIGSLLGMGMGMFAQKMPMLAGGGEVPDEEMGMPMDGPMMGAPAVGNAVPEQASPSGGQGIDDVDAKLTVGEFVVPKDVTDWYGEKYMHGLIVKARKEMETLPQQSGAVPDWGPASEQGPTTFTTGIDEE